MTKKIIFILILFVYSCASSGKKSLVNELLTESKDKNYFEIGLKYAQSYEASNLINKDDFNNAAKNFKRALSEDKTNFAAWYNLARLYYFDGNYSISRKSIIKALELNSSYAEAYTLYLKTYLAENNIEEAKQVIATAKNIMPNNKIIQYLEASVLCIDGKNEEAINIAKEIIKQNSNFAPAYILLGNIYFLEGKTELARLIYSKSLEIKEQNPSVYSNLGLVNLDLDEKNEAYINLKNAVDKAPSSAYSHLNISKYYLDAGDFENALNEVKIAISIYPKFSYAYNNMGLAYMRLGLYNDAKTAFDKAIEINPINADVYFNYGVLVDDYFSDIDKALEYYNKYIELSGDKINKTNRVYNYIKTIETKKIKKEKLK